MQLSQEKTKKKKKEKENHVKFPSERKMKILQKNCLAKYEDIVLA